MTSNQSGNLLTRMASWATYLESEPSRTLGFYRCGDKSYLCAVEGRNVMEKFR